MSLKNVFINRSLHPSRATHSVQSTCAYTRMLYLFKMLWSALAQHYRGVQQVVRIAFKALPIKSPGLCSTSLAICFKTLPESWRSHLEGTSAGRSKMCVYLSACRGVQACAWLAILFRTICGIFTNHLNTDGSKPSSNVTTCLEVWFRGKLGIGFQLRLR